MVAQLGEVVEVYRSANKIDYGSWNGSAGKAQNPGGWSYSYCCRALL